MIMLTTNILLLCISLLLTGTGGKISDDQRQAGVEKSSETITNLYITLRNIAFSGSPLNNDVTSNRLVMQMPGKVLNYWDYFPGEDYETSLVNPNPSAPEVLIPPSVMERWCLLADGMVGADIFSGESGKSLSVAYETIVKQMKILGIDTKTASIQATYNMANQYLTGTVPDPNDVSKTVTRLALYYRYQTGYAQKKLEMEETINDARNSMEAIEYELWFQRHYTGMNAKLESEYIRWVAFGNKETVELHLAHLDSASAGMMLEEARQSLRASGVLTTDRSRTVYPVSFVPGNWYKYLLPKQEKASKDVLLGKKSQLLSAKNALKNMMDFNSNITDAESTSALKNTQAEWDAAIQTKVNHTQNATSLLMECFRQRSHDRAQSSDIDDEDEDDPCKKLKDADEAAVGATFQQAIFQYRYESAGFILNLKNMYNDFLQGKMDKLDQELSNIDAELESAEHDFDDPVAGGDPTEGSSLTDTETLDDAWTQFEYDSESSHLTSDKEVTAKDSASSIGLYLTKDIGLGLQFQKGKATAKLKQSINSANTTISGEILRVAIKRPWFKPSLFEDPSLSFVQHDDINVATTYVSPGPLTEIQLQEAMGGTQTTHYLLPEFVSSFLLARNLKLQFSGLDSTTVTTGMQAVSGTSFGASFGFINFKAGVDRNGIKKGVRVEKTATGMTISVPGTQIIGYFTNILPRFPPH